MAQWDTPVELSTVRVITLDRPGQPASSYGVRDFDVQLQTGGSWHTVAQVKGNTKGTIKCSFAATRAKALRIWTTATNDGKASRLVELEAYGPGGSPRSVWVETYGGPGAPFPE